MAVYERTYKRYVGDMIPQWARFLVLPRYAFKDVFKSKLFLIAFIASFIWPLICAAGIFLRNNATFLEAVPDFGETFFAIDARFFRGLMEFQIFFPAGVIALFAGPGLVSRDLANNGLPLYLCRPFSRAEYVLGKFSILAVLLSAITWIPGWLLFALQGNYAGRSWIFDNLDVAVAIFVSAWTWIVIVSLMALAFSAWVRWRPLAAFMMLFVPLAGSLFGTMVNGFFRTEWGSLINLVSVILKVNEGLFGLPAQKGIPVGMAWLSLVACGGFFLFLLHRKIRAYEVVR